MPTEEIERQRQIARDVAAALEGRRQIAAGQSHDMDDVLAEMKEIAMTELERAALADFAGFVAPDPLPPGRDAETNPVTGLVLITYDEPLRELNLRWLLASRVARLRSGRRDPETGVIVRHPEEGYKAALRARWPERFACEIWCEPGWQDLIIAMNEMLDDGNAEITFLQVKEKFGQLRAPARAWGDPEPLARQIISVAGDLSYSICERCGAPGTLRNDGGSYSTDCAGHARIGGKIVPARTGFVGAVRRVGHREDY